MFRKNKNGQLFGPNISLIAATIVVVIILIVSVFLVRIIVSPASNPLPAVSLQSQAMTSLESYLQTPVNVNISGNMQWMEISDLIRLASLNETYKSQVDSVTKEIFGRVYGKSYGIEIPGIIAFNNKMTSSVISALSSTVSAGPDYSAFETISLPGNIPSITFYLYGNLSLKLK